MLPLIHTSLIDQKAPRLARSGEGRFTRLAGVIALFLLLGFGTQTQSFATVVPYAVNLGTAKEFAVLLTGPTSGGAVFDLQGTSVINGDIGLGEGVTMKTSGKSITIHGDVFTVAPIRFSPGSSIENQQVQSPAMVNQAISDAIKFSQTIAGFTATQTLSSIKTTTTLKGNGGINVIDFKGGDGLALDNKAVLTLSGNANDIFYINFLDEAGFSISGAAQIALAGGVNPNNIYWNVVSGKDITVEGGTVYGSLLNITRTNSTQEGAGDFTVKNAALYGRIVGGGESSNVINGTVIEIAEIQQAPEVSSIVMLLALGFSTICPSLLRRWGQRRILFSWA
jgi:hypothetical protein